MKEFDVKQKAFLLTEGVQEARVLRILDIGTQPQPENSKYPKDPKRQILAMFELANDQIEIEGEQKPAVVSLRVNFGVGDRSKMAKLVKALGLAEKFKFSDMLGKPISLTIENKQGSDGVTRSRIKDFAGLSPKVAATVPQLVAESYLFDFDEPDLAILDSLSDYMKKMLQKAAEYPGSKLEKLLGTPQTKATLDEGII